MDRYVIQPSGTRPNSWVLTDVENNVVIRFKQGAYNETQEVTFLEDNVALTHTPLELAQILREMGEWVYNNHKELI
jgi:hypothetical protein